MVWKIKLNKASVLVNKVKGVNNAIALIKHSFRETKENKGNIFESKTENNLYWIQDKLFNSDENKKTVFMKDLLLKNTDIVKLEFEKTMAKTKISRRQTWESYSFNKYIMQEVLINISPAWWEEQKLVSLSYH